MGWLCATWSVGANSVSGQHTFLKSNRYGSEEEIRFQGTPILDTYDEGLDYLAAHMPRYVRLFASPAVKRDGDGTLLTVAWYGDDVGQMQVWESLDQTGKVRVAAVLRGFLSDLLNRIHRFDDPQARMILGWLNILSFDADMLVINGQPVITNWGIVPAGVASSADRMAHHLLHGIGQFLPENYDLTDFAQLMLDVAESPSDVDEQSEQPSSRGAAAGLAAGAGVVAGAGAATAAMSLGDAVSSDSSAAEGFEAAHASYQSEGVEGAAAIDPLKLKQSDVNFASDGAEAGAAGATASAAGAYAGRGGDFPGGRRGEQDEPWGRICWVPVLIACIVSLLLLLIALIPGVLIYPYGSSAASLLSQSTIRQSEQALRTRIADLRSQLSQRRCVAAPGLLGPDGVLPQGASGAEGGDQPAAVPTGPVAAQSPTDLVPLLDQATVLVLATGAKGQVSSGSGFLIAPNQIVTNRHVIETAQGGQVFVINETLGDVRKANVVATSSTSELGDKDYALLAMEGAPANRYLQLTRTIGKGQQTYAAGFPGFFMETDAKFRELLAGDAHAAPSMVLTQGIVTVFQDSPSGLKLVLHSADISPGNSGGPLVDACGSVVGVNTFIKTSDEAQLRLNFALKSDSLLDFLAQNGVEATTASAPCPLASANEQAGS